MHKLADLSQPFVWKSRQCLVACIAVKPKVFIHHSIRNPLVVVTVVVSCQRVSNCSSRGNCTGPNVCDCQSGYKSIGCAQGNI